MEKKKGFLIYTEIERNTDSPIGILTETVKELSDYRVIDYLDTFNLSRRGNWCRQIVESI